MYPTRATRDRARVDILAVARAVLMRGGRAAFTVPEVIAGMRRRGSGCAEQTTRTMIAAHLCADASGNRVACYADLLRAGRGQYRLTPPPTNLHVAPVRARPRELVEHRPGGGQRLTRGSNVSSSTNSAAGRRHRRTVVHQASSTAVDVWDCPGFAPCSARHQHTG